MIGRGVNNKMKISGILNAIECVKKVYGNLPVNLLVVLDGEEEMFSPTLSKFILNEEDWLQRADALYMPFSSQKPGSRQEGNPEEGVLVCLETPYGRGEPDIPDNHLVPGRKYHEQDQEPRHDHPGINDPVKELAHPLCLFPHQSNPF